MRVVVVDNDLANGLVARSILTRDNHDVTIVTDGASALRQSVSQSTDIFLLDIVMPGVDGLHIARCLRNRAVEGPTPMRIALTAYSDADDIETYQRSGLQGLIAKPLRPGDLDKAVKKIKAGHFPMINCLPKDHKRWSQRPLLDERVIRQGPGLADDITRERIWRHYRSGLSDALRNLSYALPGTLRGDIQAQNQMLKALHALRSASLMVGLDRAPTLAEALRDTPPHQIIDRVTELLEAIRESLPLLQAVLIDVNRQSVATRQQT